MHNLLKKVFFGQCFIGMNKEKKPSQVLLIETVFPIFDGTQLFDVDASFNEDQQSYQLVLISPKGLYLTNIMTFFNIFASR